MKKWICMLLVMAALLLAGCDSQDYQQAQALYQAGDYAAAAQAFDALGDYRDSSELASACHYAAAKALFDAGEYTEASREFTLLGDYEDSAEMVSACQYALAEKLYEAGELLAAEASFRALGDYQDSPQRVLACRYEQAVALLETGDYAGALEALEALGDYADGPELLQKARWLLLQEYLIAQPLYYTAEGDCVGITTWQSDELTLWVERTMDLGFYVEVHRCAIRFNLGASQGDYELLTQTQTNADGLTGRTSCSASGTVELASVTADTLLPLTNVSFHGEDVYGDPYDASLTWDAVLTTPQGLLKVLLEQIPVLLEQSGTGYTLQELGFTGIQ